MEKFVPQASAKLRMPRKSPRWVGSWLPKYHKQPMTNKENFDRASSVPQVALDMKEVFSTNTDYHKNVRFINSIQQEVREVPEEKVVKNPSRDYIKIADAKLSNSQIRSVDTYGELVCYGDSSGGVGVFLADRFATMKVHNQPVTRVLCVGGNQNMGILSSAKDGNVRLTDLTKQEVVVKYSWIKTGVKEEIGWLEPWKETSFLMNCNKDTVKRIDIRSTDIDTILSFTDKDLNTESWSDPMFGTNIGVHPTNSNLISFCHHFSVKIFDLRNTDNPVDTINMGQIQPPGESPTWNLHGLSGANWSSSGKYFLACPVKLIGGGGGYNTNTKTLQKPYIFNSTDLSKPVQFWPPVDKKSPYEGAAFSHNFGVAWSPWEEEVYWTTASWYFKNNKRPGIPSKNTVVAIEAASGEVVTEIFEDLNNPSYLIGCHRSKNWVVVGNARGAGDLVIYQAGQRAS